MKGSSSMKGKGKGWRIRRGNRKEGIHGRDLDEKDVRVKEGEEVVREGQERKCTCGRGKITVE